MMTKQCAASLIVLFLVASSALCGQGKKSPGSGSTRLEGPCDIYAAAGDPCVAAHSTTRALYRSYDGPLYQVVRQSDGKALDVPVVASKGAHDPGGYADAAAQDAFCKDTYCWIARIYDQSPKHNDLTQAPRGGFSGPAMGGMNNLPLADMAPVSLLGHKVYGVFIEPGTGLRIDDPRGTAVDDQAEGQYWVINGRHFNAGCCFDYGNAEIDSRDDDNGTMETAYYGDNTGWIHGNPPGPWIETDQENNLVGCVPDDDSRLCAHLPDIHWRFVTAIAKGEPHHWTSMGADAQQGALTVMFDGRRVNSSYDPMRKQGSILLGNGGDNSNSSQGTFYEGAVTAAGTFPTDATDQAVQANIVAAGYGVQALTLLPAAGHPTGVLTFALHSVRDVAVSYTNVTTVPVRGVTVSVGVPAGWSAVLRGTGDRTRTFAEAIAPGASVTATFSIGAGAAAYNGDVVASASWTDAATHLERTEIAPMKVRSAMPVKINEFRISSGIAGNTTDSFIELFNGSNECVDLSRWTMTVRPTQSATFSSIAIPAGTTLRPKAFYLLGLANSALAIPSHAGAKSLLVRSTAGMSVGDVVRVGSDDAAEERTITAVGVAASDPTTLWQPLPDGPIQLAPHSSNVPVESVAGFHVGEQIAIGYGATEPFVGNNMEQYEVATVTAVGKPGTQAYLADDAQIGATNLKVTSVENITVGDAIRLDIASSGHGVETVRVTRVGTAAAKTNLVGDFQKDATRVRVRRAEGFHSGDRILIGTPATKEQVTLTTVQGGRGAAELSFTPALSRDHGRDEWVVSPGSGLEIAAPLRFAHASNLPFSDRGTGISFAPATRFAHISDEPVQALGTGLTLDRPLSNSHAVATVVQDASVTTAGYQGVQKPDQWFGGPELVTRSLSFGRVVSVRQASMVLRDAAGQVVDTVNYGALVDPWAAKGDQSESGPQSGGCFVASPEPGIGPVMNRSAGRYPDGADSDSDCHDFRVQAATVLPVGADAGSTRLQVASVAGFHAGQTVVVGTAADAEQRVIAAMGTAGAARTSRPEQAASMTVSVASPFGFEVGQNVQIGSGAAAEEATIATIRRAEGFQITFTKPLRLPHPADSLIAGTGLTLTSALTHAHAAGAQVGTQLPTPGAANRYETEVQRAAR